ncbi:hypothetical protein EXM22_11585 [Oceanispirochaeta crateris]|uniref:HPr family phosphocarrier protein n=1 Tax=Oceanispirochaeta crateris TaxID=2518645 RepID=A0A5C1QKD3_9SPIO|nr:hypothetical protein [Oceanispirochaeta crateris]QEN08595.1 hypothetical protein EXM22_11585 [Oceanispirochaeta crateris]
MQTIDNQTFKISIAEDLQDLLSISAGLGQVNPEEVSRPLLGRLNLESSRCEELLDSYGAQQNTLWSPLRKITAVIKAFSRVAYSLLHIKNAIPSYNLVALDDNFVEATENMIKSVYHILEKACLEICKLNKSLDINPVIKPMNSYRFGENEVSGCLDPDRVRKASEFPGKTAVYLATSFLNLAEESILLKIYKKLNEDEYSSAIPEEVSEEKLRLLENKFHNLQSLYDTYLSGSDVAQKDPSLPVLRGHISVVYHLLECATNLTHYYERHSMYFHEDTVLEAPVMDKVLLTYLMQYFIAFPERYILTSQKLCKEILKHYAEMGSIEVPIPNYRGFHVRPSTLIAKIVVHYGSDVTMMLGSNEYNASMPLELFRANEEINQVKRKSVSECLVNHKLIAQDINAEYDTPLMKKILRIVFLDLLEKQKIMIYDNNFSFDDLTPLENETLGEFAKRGIALYLAMGKIDIISDTTVTFKGDKRVLQDLETLANHGYGEDKFGNNIVLPASLSYLRR